MNPSNFLKFVLAAIALAMGVAVVVTNAIGPMSVLSSTNLLAIGVVALGISMLQRQ